jgi:hypothetical protein
MLEVEVVTQSCSSDVNEDLGTMQEENIMLVLCRRSKEYHKMPNIANVHAKTPKPIS